MIKDDHPLLRHPPQLDCGSYVAQKRHFSVIGYSPWKFTPSPILIPRLSTFSPKSKPPHTSLTTLAGNLPRCGQNTVFLALNYKQLFTPCPVNANQDRLLPRRKNLVDPKRRDPAAAVFLSTVAMMNFDGITMVVAAITKMVVSSINKREEMRTTVPIRRTLAKMPFQMSMKLARRSTPAPSQRLDSLWLKCAS